jgi:hypothetical protein
VHVIALELPKSIEQLFEFLRPLQQLRAHRNNYINNT